MVEVLGELDNVQLCAYGEDYVLIDMDDDEQVALSADQVERFREMVKSHEKTKAQQEQL